MVWSGIQRNRLDYILTDLLPVELSELFSFKQFYDFLNKKESRKILDKIVEEAKKNKSINIEKLFEKGWDTQPLKYSILKGSDSLRRMSIVQPLSAINLYLFIETYQKDLLNYFEKEHCFSLRYHKKSNDLYYKGRSKGVLNYFQNQSKQSGKMAIQQMGTFFKTVPFESINSFTGSLKWRMSNFNYSYYAQIDYKSCFDSIYTHAYKWIIERNVIDSKVANHSSLFITIDRILQNINAKSSNGLIVGPEFSRMIAEVLLQHIDKEVKISLAKEKILQGRDFVAYRYVDDIFIFGKSLEIVNKVIDTFSNYGQRYLIQLNELKVTKGETPCLPKEWLAKTRNVSDVLNDWFYTKQEYLKQPDNEKHIVKKDFVFIDRIKDDITVLIKIHELDRRTIVSYLISTIFNNVSRKKDGYTLFGSNNFDRPLMLLDMVLFIYAFCPSYEQTRKLISIIVYMNNELDFKKDDAARIKLSSLLNRYGFVFINGNIYDLVDWFVFLLDYRIALDIKIEKVLIQKANQLNDPVIWANLLLYSRYNHSFFNETLIMVEKIIESELDKITDKFKMLNKEFWYVLVFHNCPFITSALSKKIETVINAIKPNTLKLPSEKAINLVFSFLDIKNVHGKKPEDSLFNWSGGIAIGEKITYRTYQRTVFKKYNKRNGIYSSLD